LLKEAVSLATTAVMNRNKKTDSKSQRKVIKRQRSFSEESDDEGSIEKIIP
jgi:hypothetical protein